jgi:hypothetical protein
MDSHARGDLSRTQGNIVKKSVAVHNLCQEKFFYLFTCEYCFSHYISIIFLIITKFQLLYDDWQGYLLAFFSLVWIANWYMSLFGYMRQSLKAEKIEAKMKDENLKEMTGDK